jgi:hypothetical protein
MGGSAPVLTGDTGVKVAVNEDTINRVLEMAWRKGQLDFDYKAVSTGQGTLPNPFSLTFTAKDLALLIPALNAIIPAGAGLEIKANAKAAPVVKLSAGGNATFEITDLQLEIGIILPAPFSTYLKLMVLDVNAQAPVTFSVVGTTTRALQISVGAPKFEFDLLDAIVNLLPKTQVETALSFIVPTVVQFGAKFVGPIPLPALDTAGLKPTVDTITTDGAQGTFLRTDISIK